MTIYDIKRLLDEIDLHSPLYFLDINWKANKYEIREMHEWRMIIHTNEEISFGYGDNNTYQLGRTVFVNRKQAEQYREILNKAGMEILK